MSNKHGAREQKRLAKQKAKRETKRRQLARSSSPDPNVRLKAADRWPLVAALVPQNLWDIGLGNLLIARRTHDGQLACAIFLVDVFCLGVKDATWLFASPGRFNEIRGELNEQGRLEEVTPEHFAKLVYCAADYGQSLGFPPHRDFRHAQKLLAGIDPSQCPDDFEFGQGGRPIYIRGPSESADEARIIAARMRALGGEHIVPLTPSEVRAELMADVDNLDLDEEDEDEHD